MDCQSTDQHPQQKSHFMQKRKHFFVPVLISPSFPRRSDEMKIDLYCQLMLILFKPWRTVNDIRNTDETWLEAFIKFERCQDSQSLVRKYMQNIDYLKIAEKEAEEDIISKKTTFEGSTSTKSLLNDFLAFENDNEDDENPSEFDQFVLNHDVTAWTENGTKIVENLKIMTIQSFQIFLILMILKY